jgi:serine/threonine protein kinase
MIEAVTTSSRIDLGFPVAVLREIKILRQLRFHVKQPHPNIITLRDIVLHRQQENTICLVMDYMDVDLNLLLEHTGREIPKRVSKCYLHQVRRFITVLLLCIGLGQAQFHNS